MRWLPVLLLFCAPALHAQDGVMISGDSMMYSVPDYGSTALSQSILHSTVRQQQRRGQSRAGDKPTREPAGGPARKSTSIRYDSALSRQIEREYLDNLARRAGPKAAAAFGAYFRQHPVQSQYAIAAGPYGLRKDDLADVATAYFVVMWMAANQSSLPGKAQVNGVSAQFRQGVGSLPSLPDDMGKRQRVAEMMMYKLVSMILLREEAQRKGDKVALKQLADSAQRDMLGGGMDMRATALTAQGFKPR